MSKSHTIEFVKEMAKTKNCTLLSTKYKNQKQKLEFQCSEGHVFHKDFDKMLNQNQGCPICVRGISEELCRYVLETSFNKKFNKTMFNFKNHTLELDGYNEEHKIAFEYNGRQHYELTTMIKTNEELERRKYLDTLKLEYCHINNIKLIIIPYTISNEEISKFICEKIKHKNIINTQEFIENYSYFKTRKINLESIINEKNGKLLSFNFNFIKLQCEYGHTWTSKYYIIKNGHWCKTCSHNDKIRSFNEILLTIKNKGISCLSKEIEYKNSKSILKFKCQKGHIFNDTVDYLLERINAPKNESRKICQYCITSKQDNILQKIKTEGLILSNELNYKNRNIAVEWVCKNGHKQKETLKNLAEKLRRKSHLCKCIKCIK